MGRAPKLDLAIGILLGLVLGLVVTYLLVVVLVGGERDSSTISTSPQAPAKGTQRSPNTGERTAPFSQRP
jgi:hypothetical protein